MCVLFFVLGACLLGTVVAMGLQNLAFSSPVEFGAQHKPKLPVGPLSQASSSTQQMDVDLTDETSTRCFVVAARFVP